MIVLTGKLDVQTRGELDILDITDRLEEVVRKSGIKEGIATVFVSGSTAAITTMVFEPGLESDMRRSLSMLFPKELEYEHHKRWGDHNGHVHVRASFLGPSLTIPVTGSSLTLGRWQQVVLIELDVSARKRSLVVKIVGEK
jgi:secondary thiamine-phosphate synthase enzyme